MKLCDLISKLDIIVPKSLSEEWDNDGEMLVFDSSREIKKILLVLDVTEESVDYAQKIGADLIISHHPLIFHPLANLSENPKTKLILRLVSLNIQVLSFHTRFDSLEGGMNDALAGKLCLEKIEKLQIMARMGDLPTVLSPKELSYYVSEKLDADVILYSAGKPVKKVAVTGGGGKDFVSIARVAGADAIVTGDVSHSVVTDEVFAGITIVDAGHFGTEKIFATAFRSLLKQADINDDMVEEFIPLDMAVFVKRER
jgi:dinuclear metal center YbgI/SA1388 family protein